MTSIKRGTPTRIDVNGGAYPGMHLSSVTFGVASDVPDVVLGSTTTATSDYTTGDFTLFYVTPGVFVYDIIVNPYWKSAFSSTGTPAPTLGMSSDLDGFFTSTDLSFSDNVVTTMKHSGLSTGAENLACDARGRFITTGDERSTEAGTTDCAKIDLSVVTSDYGAGSGIVYLMWFAKNAMG